MELHMETKEEIVISVSDTLSGLADFAGCPPPSAQQLNDKVDGEMDLCNAIYSLYASKKRRGVTWTKECVTVQIRDAMDGGDAGNASEGL
jgi:hypothetical protein